MYRAGAALVLLSLVAACSSGATPPGAPPTAGFAALRSRSAPVVAGCQIFPSPVPSVTPSGNDWWNQDVSGYPVDPNSAKYIAAIQHDGSGQTNLHPDFGHEYYYGIPYNVVPATQRKVPVSFDYGSESDKGPYPIPPHAQIEGGAHASGDRHVLVLQQGTCRLYELWNAHPLDGGKRWRAGSGAIFDLNSTKLRPNGWTSADAAGLPIMPALIKCAEVKAGAIDHALRVTFNHTQAGYIRPATHFASSSTNANLPPMGLRLRLKASFDVSHFDRTARIILTAMKTYGLFVADNGSNWYFQGEGGSAAKCWNDNQLGQLKNVSGDNFEVVQTGPILK